MLVTMALSLTGFAPQPPYQDAPTALPPDGDRAEAQSPQRLPVPGAARISRLRQFRGVAECCLINFALSAWEQDHCVPSGES